MSSFLVQLKGIAASVFVTRSARLLGSCLFSVFAVFIGGGMTLSSILVASFGSWVAMVIWFVAHGIFILPFIVWFWVIRHRGSLGVFVLLFFIGVYLLFFSLLSWLGFVFLMAGLL